MPTTKIYGPFSGETTDSSTCGEFWANDSFDRYFVVTTKPNANGTYNVTEQFKNGTFVTVDFHSPGACESGTDNGSWISAGINGKMQGSFEIIVKNGIYNSEAECTQETCGTTAGFISTIFGTSNYDVPTFIFHYSTGKYGEWKNASANRGGNSGDICTKCFVESLTVDSSRPEGADSNIILSLGKNYLFSVFGVWENRFGLTDLPHQWIDAEYLTFNYDWSTHRDGDSDGLENLPDLQINQNFVNWGVYSSDHTYTYDYSGTDSVVNFRVFDGLGSTIYPEWYRDNNGSLTVNIFEAK